MCFQPAKGVVEFGQFKDTSKTSILFGTKKRGNIAKKNIGFARNQPPDFY
jgi:hypothetical protein